METWVENENAAPHVFRPMVDRLRSVLNTVLCGKDNVVELVVTSLLARGHLLIEDLPGLGKTTLAKAIARAIGGEFSRVQCTPDLLPTDITGFNIFNQATRQFEFQRGPVFTDVLLADEINRATPRTQSALFEAMAERQVTIDRETHALPRGFFVIATQNPVDSHGTYPLPEAQLDRFAVKLSIGYPGADDETRMLGEAIQPTERDRSQVEEVLSVTQLHQLQQHIAALEVTETVRGYIVSLGNMTRKHSAVHIGLSPRGLLMWQRLAQAHAYLVGRDFVTPDDVQAVAQPALGVRLTGDFESAHALVEGILSEVQIPWGQQ
jgi:MoxR-like ATPase